MLTERTAWSSWAERQAVRELSRFLWQERTGARMGRGAVKQLRSALAIAALLLAAAAPPPIEPPGAESCTGCHVRGGGIGLLQGRPAADTVRILEDYRAGWQPATLMNRIVKGFTPDEVVQLSLWFAAAGPPGP